MSSTIFSSSSSSSSIPTPPSTTTTTLLRPLHPRPIRKPPTSTTSSPRIITILIIIQKIQLPILPTRPLLQDLTQFFIIPHRPRSRVFPRHCGYLLLLLLMWRSLPRTTHHHELRHHVYGILITFATVACRECWGIRGRGFG